MSKAYWVVAYRAISKPAALVEYSALAGPAVAAGGGRFLTRSVAEKAFEAGLVERTVVIEFDSIEQAMAVHSGEAYQAALKVLGDAAERDFRLVKGV